LEDATSAQLSALTFGDTNDSGNNIRGVFRFNQSTLNTTLSNAGLSSFRAGTIITVTGTNLGPQNLSYNPLMSNPSNHADWNIQLVAGQGALDHPETNINGNIEIQPSGEVVWISTSNPPANSQDTSGFIHAIGSSSNGSYGVIGNAVVSQFGANNIITTSVPTNQSVANLSTTNEILSQTSSPTLGNPNGGANTNWIEFIRTNGYSPIPEPSRVMLVGMGLLMCFSRRRRSRRYHSHD
jgi:hypothetical protein